MRSVARLFTSTFARRNCYGTNPSGCDYTFCSRTSAKKCNQHLIGWKQCRLQKLLHSHDTYRSFVWKLVITIWFTKTDDEEPLPVIYPSPSTMATVFGLLKYQVLVRHLPCIFISWRGKYIKHAVHFCVSNIVYKPFAVSVTVHMEI